MANKIGKSSENYSYNYDNVFIPENGKRLKELTKTTETWSNFPKKDIRDSFRYGVMENKSFTKAQKTEIAKIVLLDFNEKFHKTLEQYSDK